MALEWLPEYPDWLPRRRRQAIFEPIERQNLDPIINPPPPTELTWRPGYPDSLRRLMLSPAISGRSFAPVPALLLLSPLLWLGRYPDSLRRPQLPVALRPQATFPWSVQPIIPVQMGWRPRYPDRVSHRFPTRTGQFPWLIASSTIINAAPCVEWAEETWQAPTFTEEVLPGPTFVDEGWSAPTFESEDLC